MASMWMTPIDLFYLPAAFVVGTTAVHVPEIKECYQRWSRGSTRQHLATLHRVLRQYIHFLLVSIGLLSFTHFSSLVLAWQS